MATFGFETTIARFPARMGRNPGVERGIIHFAAIASIFGGNLALAKGMTTVGTTPTPRIGRRALDDALANLSMIRMTIELLILFLLKNAVPSPSLNACDMKRTEAIAAVPNGIALFDGRNADETRVGATTKGL